MVLRAVTSGSSPTQVVNDLLNEIDIALEAGRSALRLALVRSTQTRLYSLGGQSVVELDNQKVFLFDPHGPRIAMYQSVLEISREYPDEPLVFKKLVPALAARSVIQSETRISQTEQRYLGLMLRGYANKEIGRLMNHAQSTVKNRISRMYARFGVHSRAEMMATAMALGLVPNIDAQASSARSHTSD